MSTLSGRPDFLQKHGGVRGDSIRDEDHDSDVGQISLFLRDRWGGTPIGDARRHGHSRVAQLLENHIPEASQ
ncbi:MAG: hypothetical protein ABGY96_09870 [bacterium]|nr:hypothetical protein [Gammaproteobacteria bacterium]